MAWQLGTAGVYERGKGTRGLPRNLGGPNCSIGSYWYWVTIGRQAVDIQAYCDLISQEHSRSNEENERAMVPLCGGDEGQREGIRAS
jgi:hypothetical protein